MTDRGLLMEGEFRYLTRSSEGQFGAAYLDDSNDDRKLQSEYEDQRWMYSWQNRTGLDSRWLAEVDYTDISDPYYFRIWIPTSISTSPIISTSAARSRIAGTPIPRA